MKKQFRYSIFFLIFSIGFSQAFDPESGEMINKKTENMNLYDPITGELKIKKQEVTTYQSNINVRQLAFSDVKNNFNTKMTWSILGGGISVLTTPPLAIVGMLLGGEDLEFYGFLGGVSLGTIIVPILIAKNESSPSRLVLQQQNIQSLSPKDKLIYIKEYSKITEKKRLDAIKKGQLGWALGGFGSMVFLAIALD